MLKRAEAGELVCAVPTAEGVVLLWLRFGEDRWRLEEDDWRDRLLYPIALIDSFWAVCD